MLLCRDFLILWGGREGDWVKDALEFGGADGVDCGEMENAALEVLGEGGVSLAVLGLWALAEGVGEDGFKVVVSGAGEVGLFVDG